VLAARKLGMATVPVIELAGMSDAEKRAYIIADNKLALKAGWDIDARRRDRRPAGGSASTWR
jgi:ParB-like chromosome segregation protein Spo0J